MGCKPSKPSLSERPPTPYYPRPSRSYSPSISDQDHRPRQFSKPRYLSASPHSQRPERRCRRCRRRRRNRVLEEERQRHREILEADRKLQQEAIQNAKDQKARRLAASKVV